MKIKNLHWKKCVPSTNVHFINQKQTKLLSTLFTMNMTVSSGSRHFKKALGFFPTEKNARAEMDVYQKLHKRTIEWLKSEYIHSGNVKDYFHDIHFFAAKEAEELYGYALEIKDLEKLLPTKEACNTYIMSVIFGLISEEHASKHPEPAPHAFAPAYAPAHARAQAHVPAHVPGQSYHQLYSRKPDYRPTRPERSERSERPDYQRPMQRTDYRGAGGGGSATLQVPPLQPQHQHQQQQQLQQLQHQNSRLKRARDDSNSFQQLPQVQSQEYEGENTHHLTQE